MAKKQDDSGGVPEWLVTFGDMMSLLLTFFIMLFSMSEIKKDDKFHAMVESLRKTFGYESSLMSSLPGQEQNQNSIMKSIANLARAKRLNLMQGGNPVKAPTGENKLVLSPRDDGDPNNQTIVPFPEGSDQLTDKAKQTLDQMAKLILGIPQMIEVQGHTSKRPLPEGSPFRDHQDLAYKRARDVQAYLESLGINHDRIIIRVVAGNEVRYSGTDPSRQEENSRVEVRVLSKKFNQKDTSKPPDE